MHDISKLFCFNLFLGEQNLRGSSFSSWPPFQPFVSFRRLEKLCRLLPTQTWSACTHILLQRWTLHLDSRRTCRTPLASPSTMPAENISTRRLINSTRTIAKTKLTTSEAWKVGGDFCRFLSTISVDFWINQPHDVTLKFITVCFHSKGRGIRVLESCKKLFCVILF